MRTPNSAPPPSYPTLHATDGRRAITVGELIRAIEDGKARRLIDDDAAVWSWGRNAVGVRVVQGLQLVLCDEGDGS